MGECYGLNVDEVMAVFMRVKDGSRSDGKCYYVGLRTSSIRIY